MHTYVYLPLILRLVRVEFDEIKLARQKHPFSEMKFPWTFKVVRYMGRKLMIDLNVPSPIDNPITLLSNHYVRMFYNYNSPLILLAILIVLELICLSNIFLTGPFSRNTSRS